MSLDELMKLVLGALEDLKAQNIQVLDVHELTTITERMVICSGTSSRQVKALADNVVKEAKQHGHPPIGVEGTDAAEWILVDLGDVVVHVMHVQARMFYQLEKLWDVKQLKAAESADE